MFYIRKKLTMKKFFTFLVLFITFSMNAQVGTYDIIQNSSGISAINIDPDGDVTFYNDLQLSSIKSNNGINAIDIDYDGDVTFYNGLQLSSIKSNNGNYAIDIDYDGDVTFYNGLQLSSIKSSSGNYAIDIDYDGDVTFYNGLQLSSIKSVDGNNAIDIDSYGDVSFSNALQLSSIKSGNGIYYAIDIDSDGDVRIPQGITLAANAAIKGDSGNDALSIDNSDNIQIENDLTVAGDVVVSSDARLKTNIVSLGSTLSRLLLIDGKKYKMKKDGNQKIGLLAQEIQEVFPELVSEGDNKMLAVNYQGLVPVLINAIKEQDLKMKEQGKRLERLENIISSMDK
jgi:flagellar capping protein FliD